MLSCSRLLPPKAEKGSAEGQALPVLQLLQAAGDRQCGVSSPICSLRLQSVPALKAPRAVEYKCLQKLNNSSKIHIRQTSLLFPDDITRNTKHKQKNDQTKHEGIVGKKNHLVKSFSAVLTAIRTVIMLKWLASPENWIN